MTDATPYIVPKEPGLGRALTLAALVHAALLAFLWIGVQWQSETPSTIEAEVWSPQPREAALLPEPVKAPEPEPEPKPEPVVEEPPKPKVVEPPPVAKPDIALEQEKKRKAEEKKRREEEERLAKEKKRREEEERLAKEKKRVEEEKLKLAKLKQLEKEKADKAMKEAAEKKRKQEEAEAKMLAKLRDEEMRRMAGGVTGTGGTGDAPKAQGGRASAEYGAKVAARIRSHTVFNVPVELAGNPPVEYLVELLPDGTLRGAPRKLKPSGVPGFDEAVLRAIDKSQPFPRDEKTGAVPSRITISHKPKDQ